MSVSERLDQAITGRGLSGRQAADVCGVPARTIQNWIKGDRTPNAADLGKVCAHLGVNGHWLLTGDGAMYTDGGAQYGPASSADCVGAQIEQMVRDVDRVAAIGRGDVRGDRLVAFLTWLLPWWRSASEEDRIWPDGQLRRSVPDYADWLASRAKTGPDGGA